MSIYDPSTVTSWGLGLACVVAYRLSTKMHALGKLYRACCALHLEPFRLHV